MESKRHIMSYTQSVIDKLFFPSTQLSPPNINSERLMLKAVHTGQKRQKL